METASVNKTSAIPVVESQPVYPEAEPEPATDAFISDLEGYSKESLIALAEELDSALGPIMAAAGDKIVRCDLLGGAEMALSQAVNTLWPPSSKGAMIIEGLPSVMAKIQGMLANLVEEETEELEEEEAAEGGNEDKPSQDEDERAVEVETQAVDGGEVKKPEPKAEKPALSQDVAIKNSPIVKMIRETTTKAEARAKDKSRPDKIPELKKPAESIIKAESDIPTAENTIVAETEEKIDAAPEITLPVTEQEVTVADIEEELTQPEMLDPDQNGSLIIVGSEINGTIESTEPEIDAEAASYKIEGNSPDDFSEAESLGDFLEDIALESAGDFPTTVVAAEPLSLAAEETEDTIVLMTKAIGELAPEDIEEVNVCLDEILGTAAKLEASDEEVDRAGVKAELEELLVDLTDRLGIDYSPELIESMITLVLAWRSEYEINNSEIDEEEEAPRDTGTRELLRKLLLAVGDMKKTTVNAETIGKLALAA